MEKVKKMATNKIEKMRNNNIKNKRKKHHNSNNNIDHIGEECQYPKIR